MAKLRDVAKEANENRLFPEKLNKASNKYGDAKDSVYAGGTPLFDEATGKQISPAEYLLRKQFKRTR